MFHLALGPVGWGMLAALGGAWLIKRSGGSVAGAAGTVAGYAQSVAIKGASLLGLEVEKTSDSDRVEPSLVDKPKRKAKS